jgi:hypothetical protein
MNGVDIASVTRTNRQTNSPRIQFYAKWLRGMGFVPDALVQFLPEPDGMSFTLYNENIPKYSALLWQTIESGGTLMHINLHSHRDDPQLCLSGVHFNRTGLVYGDNLIIWYEYGFIRMRKLPEGAVKLVNSHLVGQWLADSGFLPDEVLTVASEPGSIICKLQENGRERTAELVKFARKMKLKLIQVQKIKYSNSIIHYFNIPSSCLEKAGFSPDDALLAVYEYGFIKLQKPDFAELGF